MNSVKNLSFPKRDQPKPTEKSWQKNCLVQKGRVSANPESLSSPEAAQLNKGAGGVPTHQRQWLTCQIAEMLARLLGMGFDCCPHLRFCESMMDWMIVSKYPGCFFGFSEGMKNYPIMESKRFFFLAPFASQVCRPFRFCC